MAINHFFFESRYLQGNTYVDVILPDLPRRLTAEEFYRSGAKYPVLWLLHGTHGDASDWQRRTCIEHYACERNVIVVMPSAQNSNYSNWENYAIGYNMYDFVLKELMPIIYGWYPASDKPEDNYIAGLSMGGRGTMKFAFNHPELFHKAAILSACPVDYSQLSPDNPNPVLNTTNYRMKNIIDNAGGLEKFLDSYENLWAICEEKGPKGELPELMFAVGTEDTLIYENLKIFKAHMDELGFKPYYYVVEGYRHEWRFWNVAIEKALDFFGLEKTGDSVF